MKTSTNLLIQSLLQAKNADFKRLTPSNLISNFKSYRHSSFCLSFYFSNRDSNSNLICSDKLNFHLERVKTSIINLFGGLSIQTIDGYFKNTQGYVMKEQIQIYTFHNFNTNLSLKNITHVLEQFLDYGTDTQQECLMLTVNNSTALINL